MQTPDNVINLQDGGPYKVQKKGSVMYAERARLDEGTDRARSKTEARRKALHVDTKKDN